MNKDQLNIPFVVSYDNDAKILRVDILHLETAEEVHEMWKLIEENFEGKQRRLTLVDLSKSRQSSMSGEARKAFRQYEDYLQTLDKTAFVISNPVIRMLVKATVAGLHSQERGTHIFKTKEEAFTWLKGGG